MKRRAMDIIDCHFHIIGARDLQPDKAFAPPPFTVDRYLQLTDRMADVDRWSRVVGGVVVSRVSSNRAGVRPTYESPSGNQPITSTTTSTDPA